MLSVRLKVPHNDDDGDGSGYDTIGMIKSRKKWMLCGNRTCAARTATTIDYNMRRPHTIELPRNVYKTPHIFLERHFIAFAWNPRACVWHDETSPQKFSDKRSENPRQTERKKWKWSRNKNHRTRSIKHYWIISQIFNELGERKQELQRSLRSWFLRKFNQIWVCMLHSVFHVAVP